MKEPIVRRAEKNPILTADDVPYPVVTVHNAGVVKHNDRYVMLFRSHLRNGRSIIGIAESDDGFAFKVRTKPFLVPGEQGAFAEYEEFGVEDPRICYLDGRYLITYSAYSRHGVRIALAQTTDFISAERVALITQADYRNVVIFPQKFKDCYVPFGPSPFGNFPLVHLDFLFAGLDLLGEFKSNHETLTLSLG